MNTLLYMLVLVFELAAGESGMAWKSLFLSKGGPR